MNFATKSLLFLFIVCSLNCNASIDSLHRVINHYIQEENHIALTEATIEVTVLLIRNREYADANASINTTIQKIDKNNPLLYSQVLGAKGLASYFEYKTTDTSQIYFEKAFGLLKNHPKSTAKGIVNILQGYVLVFNGNYDESLTYLEKSLQLIGDNHFMKINALRLLKRAYRDKGDYDKALYYIRSGIEICKSKNDYANLAHLYNDMGSIFHDMQDYDQALSNYQKTVDYARKVNLKKLESIALSNLGAIYANQGKTKESGEVLKEALLIKEEIQDSAGIAATLFYLNEQYVQKGEFDKALSSAKRIIKYYESHPEHQVMLAYVYLHASSYASELNNSILAETYANKCLTLAEKIKSKELVKYAYETLYSIKKNDGNYAAALSNYEQFFIMHDSIYTESSQNALEKERVKQKVEEEQAARKTAELNAQLLAEKNRVRTQWFLIAGILSALLLTIAILRNRYKSKLEKRLAIERLRNKISHDLHDDVGSILTGLAMQTEILEARASVEDKDKLAKVSELSRSAMLHMRDAVWAMDAEKDDYRSLVDRMNEFAHETIIPKGIQFNFNQENIDLSKNIKTEIRQNFYLIYKEAITNILKHSNANVVDVDLKSNHQTIELSIKDNGNQKNKEYKTSGLGLNSMQKRVNQISGDFLINREDGFEIVVKV